MEKGSNSEKSASTVEVGTKFGDNRDVGRKEEETVQIVSTESQANEDVDKEKQQVSFGVVDSDERHGQTDGGLHAWLTILGAFCITFSSFGFVNAWGEFQSYYQQVILKDESPSNIAWIGSIQYSLTFFPALVTGRLFDLGYLRLPLFLASSLMVLACFLTGQCTKYWQFVLCQGIAVGLASGVIFGNTVGVVPHWWIRKRGKAFGILSCGSSLGGTLFPIIFRNLVFKVGFPWTMRILGFILLFLLITPNIVLKRRLPPVNVPGGLLNLKAFRSIPYTLYTVSGFFVFLGLYTLLTYIDVSAMSTGIDENYAFYLVSIANAASLFGRLTNGFLADRIGAINVMSPVTAVAGILTYVWPFVHGRASYTIVGIIYGFASGAFVGLLAVPIVAFGEVQDVGRRSGMFLSIAACGALAGPPISGAIITATGNFKGTGIFAGSTVMFACAVMWISRTLKLGKMWGKF